MWDKSVPSVTIKLYPLTVAGVILLSGLTLGSWGLWWFQVYPPGWRSEGSLSDRSGPTFAVPDPLSSPADPLVWAPSVLEASGETRPIQTSPSPVPGETTRDNTGAGTIAAGNSTEPKTFQEIAVLRVGNQTPHPVRIALLQRGGAGSAQANSSNSANSAMGEGDRAVENFPVSPLNSSVKEPVHWDFEPGEGGYQGLILSLPQGDLKLEAGDVLVAFAQDGSRRYWGPYVVGESSLPYWNAERSEWQLLLQP